MNSVNLQETFNFENVLVFQCSTVQLKPTYYSFSTFSAFTVLILLKLGFMYVVHYVGLVFWQNIVPEVQVATDIQ